jgi:hypothetical protein
MDTVVSRFTRIAGSVVLMAVVTACGESSTAAGGESEIISRVTLTLTSPSGAVQSVYVDDPDGSGPTAPTGQVGTLTLARGVTYTGAVKFENRLVNPIVDITTEVRAEKDEHRVFYTVTPAGITVTTTDVDTQNRPLGTTFTKAIAANTATGAATVGVLLCHYDSVAKVGTATTCAGETDINVTFAATITN